MQPGGRELGGRAVWQGAWLQCWDAEEEEKQPPSQNIFRVTAYIIWPLSRAWARGRFRSPGTLKSYILPMENAWCLKASSPCLSQQAPLKSYPYAKNWVAKGWWRRNAVSENHFSAGIASASIHLGPREKPLLAPWCCCHLPSTVYFIPHIHLWVWGEGISLRRGTRSRAVFRQDYLALSHLHCLSSQKWPLQFANMHVRNTQNHPTRGKCCGHSFCLQFPLSGLPLLDSQVKQHKGRATAFSVPPLFHGHSGSYT